MTRSPKATSAAERLAKRKGVQLETVRPSGSRGQIVEADVQARLPRAVAPPDVSDDDKPSPLTLERDAYYAELARQTEEAKKPPVPPEAPVVVEADEVPVDESGDA